MDPGCAVGSDQPRMTVQFGMASACPYGDGANLLTFTQKSAD